MIPPWQKGDLTIMPRPMNSRPSHLYKHISEYNDGYNHPYGFARQKNHRPANGHNFQPPPSRRNGYYRGTLKERKHGFLKSRFS